MGSLNDARTLILVPVLESKSGIKTHLATVGHLINHERKHGLGYTGTEVLPVCVVVVYCAGVEVFVIYRDVVAPTPKECIKIFRGGGVPANIQHAHAAKQHSEHNGQDAFHL
jgi:hypothetical protein